MTAALVIVGAGPRGTGLLERIAANAPELLPPQAELTIHLVDPYPPGGGRVWRERQSPLLRMNSMAEDVTVFTDESSTVEGPVRPGPSLAEWAAGIRDGIRPAPDGLDPAVLAEIRALGPADFATRRVQGAYLAWAFDRARAGLPPGVRLLVHADTAVSLTGPPDGPQRVGLASGRTLSADLVVLALGHLDAEPEPDQAELARFAGQHGLRYLPPAYSADLDAELAPIAPGEDVLLRGFGLAFVDLMAMLTEGRGGRFRSRPDGSLRYLPSGREPVLHVGSRRGVPYHAKTGYRLRGPVPPLPRFFGPDAIDALLLSPSPHPRPLDFRADVWPLVAKEVAYGHYHELFHGHPERTALPWAEFLAEYARWPWGDPRSEALIARAVPDPADRIDFEALDRPLAGLVFDGPDALRDHLRQHIGADLDRRAAADSPHTAELGAFYALLSVYGQLPRLAAAGRLSARSLARDLDGWWRGFFSFLASGPPGRRLRELLALSEAGLVRFVGPNISVGTDIAPDGRGRFLASSPAVPGAVTGATTLIEARLPAATLVRTGSPLLRALHAEGELTEEVRADAFAGPPPYLHRSGLLRTRPEDGAVLGPDGEPHRRRFALGAPTDSRAVAAFARPRTNAPAFRQNDAAARTLLTELAAAAAGFRRPRHRGAGRPAPTEGPLPMTEPLHLAVALDGTGWHPASWREPGARADRLFTAGYWADLVAEAERGLLDFVTLEDGLSLQSESESEAGDRPSGESGDRTDQVRGRLDAVLTASRIAPLTRHIGLVPTAVATHTEPFHLSKAIATLDYVSSGRAGVRVRISNSPQEAAHFGRRTLPADPADLLDEAADYIEVLRRLWDSWEDDAEIRDAATGRFIDREKLHYIDFEGRFFKVRGPSITPRPPQGRPVVTALAHTVDPFWLVARSADVGYLTPHDADQARALVTTVRSLREQAAPPDAPAEPLHLFGELVVLLDENPDAAADRLARLDETAGEAYRSDARVFTGTPVQLADLLLEWGEAGLGGFRLRPAVLAHDLPAITRGLVPELQRRGAFRRRYEADTLRGLLGLPRPANRYAVQATG